MHMPAQVLRPGVQHQRERPRSPQPARVGRELGERGRRALHQRVVHPARMAGRQRVEFVRQREHQVAVRHLQQLAQPSHPPRLALSALTAWAVPVAARMPAPLLRPAAVTRMPLPTQRRRAATHDGPPCLGLRRAQRVLAQVLTAEVLQHLGQRRDHPRASVRLGSGGQRQRLQQGQRPAPHPIRHLRSRHPALAGAAGIARGLAASG
ncbi:MAG: hypothetical protein RL260_1767 [Pseudomonadota bacterium]